MEDRQDTVRDKVYGEETIKINEQGKRSQERFSLKQLRETVSRRYTQILYTQVLRATELEADLESCSFAKIIPINVTKMFKIGKLKFLNHSFEIVRTFLS